MAFLGALVTIALFLTATDRRLAALDAVSAPQPLKVGSAERLVVIAPHPDDETLGAGGLIQRVLANRGTVSVVLVTAGDGYVEAVVHETHQPLPRPAEYVAYGKRRLLEAHAALRTLAGDRVRLQFLGFPDRGLEALLRTHWRRTRPERSSTTAASDPPYPDAVEPDVPYDGADLRRELLQILEVVKPTIVVLPDPLDKHPDHHAAGIFTLLAIDDWLVQRTPQRGTNSGALPQLLAYLVHWPDWPPGWNATTAACPGASALDLPPNLPPRGPRLSLSLTDSEVAAKRAALARYATQQEQMGTFMAALVCRNEPYTLLSARDLHRVGNMVEWRRAPQPTPHQ